MSGERQKRRGAEGRHLLVDCSGIAPARLRDARLLRRLLRESATRAGARIVAGPHVHRFAGGGVTAVVLLAESHVALHTYPERGYLALDAFTCGARDPDAVLACIRELLAPARLRVRRVVRRPPAAGRL